MKIHFLWGVVLTIMLAFCMTAYSSRIFPHIRLFCASAGTFSGFNWSEAGKGFGPTTIKTPLDPSFGIGYPVRASIPLLLKTDTSASVAAFDAPRGPAWITTPSKNANWCSNDPENFFHPATDSNIKRICPPVLFGSKSGGDTIITSVSANLDSDFPDKFCSMIRGDIACSKSKFFLRNSSASFLVSQRSCFKYSSLEFPLKYIIAAVTAPTAKLPRKNQLAILYHDEALSNDGHQPAPITLPPPLWFVLLVGCIVFLAWFIVMIDISKKILKQFKNRHRIT
jgi:hypothetical protein